MGRWLLVLLALGTFGVAAFFAVPPLVSDCSTPRLPDLGKAALLLLPCGATGLYLMVKGDTGQRAALFAGIMLGLGVYGLALSQILPLALGPTHGCPPPA